MAADAPRLDTEVMRAVSIAIVLVAGGCIEGEDPNSCGVDSDCTGGRQCSRMERCEIATDLFDLTAHWTFNGVAPTSASPGPCADFEDFRVGAGNDGSGFAEVATCADGVVTLTRVPASMTTIEAWAYKNAGTISVVGQAKVERAGATDVTLAFTMP